MICIWFNRISVFCFATISILISSFLCILMLLHPASSGNEFWNNVGRRSVSRQLGSFHQSLVVGSLCVTKESSSGVCQSISNCSAAIDNFFRVQLTICAWQGHVPVVCCPGRPWMSSSSSSSSSDALQQPQRYPRPGSLTIIGQQQQELDPQFQEGHMGGLGEKEDSKELSITPLQSQLVQLEEAVGGGAMDISSTPLPSKSSVTLPPQFSKLQPPTKLPPFLPQLISTTTTTSSMTEKHEILFAGESGRPTPFQSLTSHLVNGSLLFSLRRPEKISSSTVKSVPHCGIPIYNIDRRNNKLRRVQRHRPNSRLADAAGHSTSSIVGGTKAAIGSFPWMAAIFKSARVGNRFRHNFLCGGSIVAPSYIVTAAHCFHKNDDPSLYTVRVGDVELSSTFVAGTLPEDVKVHKIILYPEYSPPQVYHDIALLHLKKRLSVDGSRLLPICLPDAEKKDFNWTNVGATVAGWGSTDAGRTKSPVLQQVNLPIVDNGKCDKAYEQVLGMSVYFPHGISDLLFCAGFDEGGKDACQGDSGGPLMILNDDGRWTLIGIVSVGRGCAEPGFPGLYTRLQHYISWVNNVTRT